MQKIGHTLFSAACVSKGFHSKNKTDVSSAFKTTVNWHQARVDEDDDEDDDDDLHMDRQTLIFAVANFRPSIKQEQIFDF